MPGSPPTNETFPSISCTIVPHSLTPTTPANILILLHSIGSTNESFTRLARNLSLPETTCISLRAPRSLPFGIDGYQWGEDIRLSSDGDIQLDAKFDEAGYALLKIVVDTLLETGWRHREIMFFGWGQGAICAFDFLCRDLAHEFGGLISIGGIIGSEVTTVVTDDNEKSPTPILACGGSSGLMNEQAEDRIKSLFKNVDVVRWQREGDGIMQNRDETLPVMSFFGRRLLSRRGVPQGFTEITT